MKKEPFKYFCIFIFVCYAIYLAYKHYFQTTYVYIADETNVFHSTPVCDNIDGMHVLEEIGEVIGSRKVDKKEVYCDENYIMCNYCFSPLEIKYRQEYLLKIENNGKNK